MRSFTNVMKKVGNPISHDKILDQTKLKASADYKLDVTKITSVFDTRGRKHCGKRRNCLYNQFLHFRQCFQKASFPEPSKGVLVWEWVKALKERRNTRFRFSHSTFI